MTRRRGERQWLYDGSSRDGIGNFRFRISGFPGYRTVRCKVEVEKAE